MDENQMKKLRDKSLFVTGGEGGGVGKALGGFGGSHGIGGTKEDK